jgi:hypothetical protein
MFIQDFPFRIHDDAFPSPTGKTSDDIRPQSEFFAAVVLDDEAVFAILSFDIGKFSTGLDFFRDVALEELLHRIQQGERDRASVNSDDGLFFEKNFHPGQRPFVVPVQPGNIFYAPDIRLEVYALFDAVKNEQELPDPPPVRFVFAQAVKENQRRFYEFVFRDIFHEFVILDKKPLLVHQVPLQVVARLQFSFQKQEVAFPSHVILLDSFLDEFADFFQKYENINFQYREIQKFQRYVGKVLVFAVFERPQHFEKNIPDCISARFRIQGIPVDFWEDFYGRSIAGPNDSDMAFCPYDRAVSLAEAHRQNLLFRIFPLLDHFDYGIERGFGNGGLLSFYGFFSIFFEKEPVFVDRDILAVTHPRFVANLAFGIFKRRNGCSRGHAPHTTAFLSSHRQNRIPIPTFCP